MRQEAGAKPFWYLTSLEHSARTASFNQNEQAAGIRFQPGVTINKTKLISIVQGQHRDEIDLETLINECISLCDDTKEALGLLSSDFATVGHIAKELGVSARTLQRKVKSTTGKTPSFWSALARSRKAAQALNSKTPLARIAAEHGFADQAHLTREMKRWFCLTPKQIRKDPQHLASILAEGYGTVS